MRTVAIAAGVLLVWMMLERKGLVPSVMYDAYRRAGGQ